VFGKVDLNFDEFFEWSPHRGTRSHKYKLYKKSPGTRIASEFFSERVITVWNELSVTTDFSTITRFKGSILNADVRFYCTSPGAAVSALYGGRDLCQCYIKLSAVNTHS